MSAKMLSTLRTASCVLANVLLVVSLSIFAVGFFPHKAFLPGLASWPKDGWRVQTPAPFDRVIFMVVDALRSDFVYGNASNFHFTQNLICSGAAVPFTGHASPPTITMPRVKAITTGSVPSFLDLVLNFAESDTSSTLAAQDTWLAQLRAKPDRNLVMYGDDTWLRLFPGFFKRADGTTSFFVSDFTEVDKNVTRHIPEELARLDWSAMIMHFLGLDHIGHKTGPRGPNMPAKQAEMDSIVKDIYKNMQTLPHLKDSLLVLLGDHGMNDAGNHGASSAGEVSTALTFISPKFENEFAGLPSPLPHDGNFVFYEEVEQSDIVPTLAALLDFPMPLNNLGVVIPKLLELWPNSDRLLLLFQNALQMRGVAAATFPSAFQDADDGKCAATSLSDADELACHWQKAQKSFHTARSGVTDGRVDHKPRDGGRDTLVAISDIEDFLGKAQSALSGTATNYGLYEMYMGTALTALAVLLAAFSSVSGLYRLQPSNVGFLLVNILYSITMFASSYVEEEHQFWYWALSGWLIVLHCKHARIDSDSLRLDWRVLISAVLFGITRKWTQTGQKYAGGPDIITQLLNPHPWLLWLMVILTIAYFSFRLVRHASSWYSNKTLSILPAFVGLGVLAFKIAFTAADAPELLHSIPILVTVVDLVQKVPLVNQARVVFIGLTQLLVTALINDTPWKCAQARREFDAFFHDLLSLFLITQTRTINIPIFLIFALQASMLGSLLHLDANEITVTSLLFQYSSFFAFGGTNAISSVDLSNAYNGISGYYVGLVGILTFVSNWAAPIWWVSATARLQSSAQRRTDGIGAGGESFALLTVFASISTLAVMLACTALREHLFIWTVFSPKYLYCVAWVVAHHVGINGLSALYNWWGAHN